MIRRCGVQQAQAFMAQRAEKMHRLLIQGEDSGEVAGYRVADLHGGLGLRSLAMWFASAALPEHVFFTFTHRPETAFSNLVNRN